MGIFLVIAYFVLRSERDVKIESTRTKAVVKSLNKTGTKKKKGVKMFYGENIIILKRKALRNFTIFWGAQ